MEDNPLPTTGRMAELAKDPKWAKALTHLITGGVENNKALRLLRLARERTVEAEVLGEQVTCRWLTADVAGRLHTAQRNLSEAAANLGGKDDDAEREFQKSTVAFCRLVGSYVVDEQVKAMLCVDRLEEGVLEMASAILEGIGVGMTNARKSVTTFRPK